MTWDVFVGNKKIRESLNDKSSKMVVGAWNAGNFIRSSSGMQIEKAYRKRRK